ncbi:hypothetical protein BDAP_000200 [Binucleata daphniae]
MQREFKGTFFIHGEQNYKAFMSNNTSNIVICYIEGLGGNLLSDCLSHYLYNYSQMHNYTYLQPIFRSHPNFGMYTLNNDAEELDSLLSLFDNKTVILVGSSTGCQDIVYYLKNYENKIKQAILIAPVSDREYEESNLDLQVQIDKVASYDDDQVFIYNNTAFCKERLLDLFTKNGKDDLFSSDLSDEHFKNLNTNNCFLHFILCGNDKYVIKSNESRLRLVPNSMLHKFDDAQHSLKTDADFNALKPILEKAIVGNN